MSVIGSRDTHTNALAVYDKVLFSCLVLPPQLLLERYPATIISVFIYYYLRLSMPTPASIYAGGNAIYIIHSARCSILEIREVRINIAYLYNFSLTHRL